MPRKVLLLLGLIGALACAAVQLNDPDPVQWIALYLSTAALYLFAFFGRGSRLVAGVLAGLAGLWALWIATHTDPSSLAHGFDSEEVRELGGLLLVVLSALALSAYGEIRPGPPAASER